MQSSVSVEEGKVVFPYGEEVLETYYKIFGVLSPEGPPPLVVIHGAAGTSHDYMLPIGDIAIGQHARPVIFYDQIGSGRSTHLPDKPSTSSSPKCRT